MDDDGERVAEPDEPHAARPVRPRRKVLPLVFLAGGALLAAYLGSKSPRDQHVRLVLGAGAAQVTQVEIQYVSDPPGDVARDARMSFDMGRAPRIVSHEPQLPDGEYRLRIDVDTREGRRSVERRVTLGGGTTQVDLASALTPGFIAAPPSAQPPGTAP